MGFANCLQGQETPIKSFSKINIYKFFKTHKFDRSENESCVSVCSVVSDSVALWTVAHEAPLSMESSRQEYWSELPFPTPGDLPNPGIKCMPPALAGRFFTTSATWKTQNESYYM
ncbi:unnamed protein product [Rangifer tarandus platyrhynchus]|uniref:Uncharacterized protein n=2 Tax=Rangifer tarandus platyrhynchus TaxID=3082113 RepID=A0ABN8ZPF2_RANTA|nr:unnamed protein product [Rangifer tarandus platyrhynchus]